jgi:nifR3 family TIM-barrel protein
MGENLWIYAIFHKCPLDLIGLIPPPKAQNDVSIMTIHIDTLSLTPAVFLAPMAGITDLPYRRAVARFGAGLVVSEMVASQEMVQAKPGVREKAAFDDDIGAAAVQLAGREAYWMAEAARQVADRGAKLIDINMGCPAKKVVNGYSGSALMRDLDHALRLIDAVVDAVDLPVTLKMRLGWDDETQNCDELARRAQSAGIKMLTVHGRTRCQFYKGQADWAAISKVTSVANVPVVANGDIVCADTARLALAQSGADAVMVGRGAQGRPWALAQISAQLAGRAGPITPTGEAFVQIVLQHYEEALSFYGNELGTKVTRKHLGWYMDQAKTPSDLRRAVLTATPGDVRRHLRAALDPAWAKDAA